MTRKEFAQAVAQKVNGTVQETEKTNGVIMTGVSIKTEGNASPTVYTDSMLEDGLTVDEAVEKILQEIPPHTICNIDVDFFKDFEAVKPRLRARLYNQKTNAEVSRKAPAPFDDLIITAYVEGFKIGGSVGAIKVKAEHLKMWDVTADEVLDIAEANSKEHATIQNMSEVMAELGHQELGLEESPMWVVSTTDKVNGAYAVIALMDELKDRFKSFTVLPSSVHEVLVVTVDSDEYDSMVQEVNDTQVDYMDQLCNHAYKVA